MIAAPAAPARLRSGTLAEWEGERLVAAWLPARRALPPGVAPGM